MKLETMMRWHLFKAFWHGVLHPWNTAKDRRAYAERSIRKLEVWYERNRKEQ